MCVCVCVLCVFRSTNSTRNVTFSGVCVCNVTFSGVCVCACGGTCLSLCVYVFSFEKKGDSKL